MYTYIVSFLEYMQRFVSVLNDRTKTTPTEPFTVLIILHTRQDGDCDVTVGTLYACILLDRVGKQRRRYVRVVSNTFHRWHVD